MSLIKYQDFHDEMTDAYGVRASIMLPAKDPRSGKPVTFQEHAVDHPVYPEAIEYLGLEEAQKRTRMLARLQLLGYLHREVY